MVSGGTGLIGSVLVNRLLESDDQVVVLSRGSSPKRLPQGARLVTWDAATVGSWAEALEGAHAVIHLAGENLASGLWTRARKRRILESRVESTRVLARVAREARTPPKVFIQASGISYYGAHEPQERVTEEDGPGDDFLARVAVAWEGAAESLLQSTPIRRVALRSAVVLSRAGGALKSIALPFRFGLGAVFGDGRQPFPWIHLSDEVEAVLFLLDDEGAEGPFNLVAPMVSDNRSFSKALARALHRPCVLRIPAFLIRWVLGEMADTVLTGQSAFPRRLLERGFRFRFPTLESALNQIYGSRLGETPA